MNNVNTANLPSWCCASGCRYCTAFREAEAIEPASAWCAKCEATVYVDDRGRCLPCGPEAV